MPRKIAPGEVKTQEIAPLFYGQQGSGTWAGVHLGKATAHQVDAHEFQWNWAGKSSKHIPFDWTGPA